MNNFNNNSKDTRFLGKNKNFNILAFVGCLLLAFVIWTYVTNVKISDNKKTITIKMDIRGEVELLNDSNYSIFGASETWVKLTLQGSKADLNRCSEKDFSVYIDVSSIDKTGIVSQNIIVENSAKGVSVVSTDPVQTTVFADERVNDKLIPVNVELAEGLVLGEGQILVIDSDVIPLSGPKTYVEEISYAKLLVNSLDLQGSSENSAYKTHFPVAFYDMAGNEITSPYLVYNVADLSVSIETNEAEAESSEVIEK